MLEHFIHTSKCFKPGNLHSWKHFLSGWFYGRDIRDVKRGNMIQFYASNFFYTYPNRLNHEERLELQEYLERSETVWNHRFPHGMNRDVKVMRITLDPVRPTHRMLSFYLIIAAANAFSRLFLYYHGFTRRSLGGFYYWVRVGESAEEQEQDGNWDPTHLFDAFQKKTTKADYHEYANDDYCLPRHLRHGDVPVLQRVLLRRGENARPKGLPIVVFHGVGHGLVFYLNMFREPTMKTNTLFLIELPHVSTRVFEHNPSPKHTVETIGKILLICFLFFCFSYLFIV